MSLTNLQSHKDPELMLHEHIEQVYAAMQGIWSWHSDKLITSEVRQLCKDLAHCHDLGKGTSQFQVYIGDPPHYAEAPLTKSHTPLSLLLTVQKAKAEKWDPLKTLLVSQCVYGHHGGFSPLPDRYGDSDAKTMDRFGAEQMTRILLKQLQGLNYDALQNETQIVLPLVSAEKKTLWETGKYLKKQVFKPLRDLAIADALLFRMKTQLLFSMLLEADKAFLAIKDPKSYLTRKKRRWRSAWIDQKIGKPKDTPLNRLRLKARNEIQIQTKANRDVPLNSLIAPTGLGKTLLAAEWALKNREYENAENQIPPKVIVVLPFLSIIDQTAMVYRELLNFGSETPDGSWFLTSHSLSNREYDPELESGEQNFFIDTWRTELVITTYDQFLMSLIDRKARYQMRFHNLCDSLIIMDEVQSVPCHMWQLLNGAFRALAEGCNSKILLMSATLPPFVPGAKPLLTNYSEFFKFNRYCFRFKLNEAQSIESFCQEMGERLPKWLETGERVLITLNTRKSARAVFDHLIREDIWPEEFSHIPIYFISADVTPKDRRRQISGIKEKNPCIVVSTQCVEAGVDIDMTCVIRDFAPWDSLVQIAGRCNREGCAEDSLDVEIVDLMDENEKRYSDMIYEEVNLSITRRLLENIESMPESETLSISESYFQQLSEARNTGSEHLEKFAYWENDTPIRELLRGKKEQHTFLVIEQDEGLVDDMEAAAAVKDRWGRRDTWRKLAGRMANISVNIYARYGFNPKEIATEKLGQYLLNHGYYDETSGLKLESKYANGNQSSLIF